MNGRMDAKQRRAREMFMWFSGTFFLVTATLTGRQLLDTGVTLGVFGSGLFSIANLVVFLLTLCGVHHTTPIYVVWLCASSSLSR